MTVAKLNAVDLAIKNVWNEKCDDLDEINVIEFSSKNLTQT